MNTSIDGSQFCVRRVRKFSHSSPKIHRAINLNIHFTGKTFTTNLIAVCVIAEPGENFKISLATRLNWNKFSQNNDTKNTYLSLNDISSNEYDVYI